MKKKNAKALHKFEKELRRVFRKDLAFAKAFEKLSFMDTHPDALGELMVDALSDEEEKQFELEVII